MNMREILFRAKRKNWRELPKEEWWVEGSYHHQTDYYGESCDKHYIIDGTETDMEGYGEHYEIDPETLCQYTGLNGKNGNRIWENDIVMCKQYIGGNFIDYHIELGFVEMKHGAYGLHRKQGYYRPFKDWLEDYEYEVLDNIFDTPELLKGEG